MKPREIKELKNKPRADLEKLLHEARERLRVLRFDLAAGKVKNVGELRMLQKDIARMLTFLRMSDAQAKQ
ncbi:MAG: 50S ribosomal protein L29 [Candidatus Liptonbacteria bacterium RIFCSPLOWO2_01_FULL_56_20]|uniref:Large ribosomal subunit protein uL29 n=1 Tax=Candidatus Liptonbacteria bacterium RIFCSPLOWO2_01_FULL_56_20 TaxID=1798652 RepID=A0A1G2CJK6_9BACT|nr:MAG: 50S ribosomal protein L29 [Parcubacteria group bacterium GW2011_GWB1_56_8]OGY97933.1 MAG: 50S ribosomal protein L29 [Candidatus Liptonbacteria bacterium RIFCSPHIGHO2_01_FULL_56_18b]OGZ01565.1 MAG: 50S ribosomal protein L29 [Candidatus Liptonbacteria bacterium RIFCSPLOWO2_01_FULL_56_20]